MTGFNVITYKLTTVTAVMLSHVAKIRAFHSDEILIPLMSVGVLLLISVEPGFCPMDFMISLACIGWLAYLFQFYSQVALGLMIRPKREGASLGMQG